MATNRLRISKQLELSASPYSIIRTGAGNEPAYLAPGADGSVLTVVGGIPQYAALPAGSSFTITDGTTPQVISAGDTLTFAAGNGAAVVVSSPDTVTFTARLSTDADNALVFGGDGGLYVPEAQLVTGATWDDATNTLTITFANGSTVDVPIVDAINTFLSDWNIQADTGSGFIENHGLLSVVGTPGQIITDYDAGTLTISLGFAEQQQVFTNLTSGTTVTLSSTPASGSILEVYRNGVAQIIGAGNDFTLAGAVLTFAVAFGNSPGGSGGENVLVRYKV
jgi:hypothetical protein